MGEAQRKTSKRRMRIGRRARVGTSPIPDQGLALLREPNEPEEASRVCAICGKRIKDIYCAVAFGDDHAAVHFECALDSIRTAHGLTGDDRLCYIGKGTFGVVSLEASGAFTVRRRISWDEGSERPPWREGLLMIKHS